MRLDVDLASPCANREAVIRVFVVRWSEARVEPADRTEQRSWRRQRRGGAVVHAPHTRKQGIVGVRAATEIPGAAIREHDPSGLLEPSAGSDQACADGAGVAVLLQYCHER